MQQQQRRPAVSWLGSSRCDGLTTGRCDRPGLFAFYAQAQGQFHVPPPNIRGLDTYISFLPVRRGGLWGSQNIAPSGW